MTAREQALARVALARVRLDEAERELRGAVLDAVQAGATQRATALAAGHTQGWVYRVLNPDYGRGVKR